MRIHSRYFSLEIQKLYNIDDIIADDRSVYVEINKCHYVMKQSAIISYLQLVKHMDGHGYYHIPFNIGLWAHRTLATNSFCIDNFGIKYFSKYEADHLLNALKKHYPVSTDQY